MKHSMTKQRKLFKSILIRSQMFLMKELYL